MMALPTNPSKLPPTGNKGTIFGLKMATIVPLYRRFLVDLDWGLVRRAMLGCPRKLING